MTCDFCHSVVAVHPGEEVPYELDVGATKRGPLEDPAPAPHEVVVSPLHTRSEFCAGCHEYVNDHGVTVLSNYSEWKQGPMPGRSVTCQGCHMEIYQARMVFSQETDQVSRNFINLHAVPGGRSVDQLRRAFGLEIVEARRDAGRLRVHVAVTNRGAGHRAPGGMPNRRAVLEVRVDGAGPPERKERVYRRTLVDSQGEEVRYVPAMFTDAAKVASDTRLRPRERRDERFSFRGGPAGTGVTARLIYVVGPAVPGAERREVEVIRVRTRVE